jgi:thioredoxin-like negative regulator of GroEL
LRARRAIAAALGASIALAQVGTVVASADEAEPLIVEDPLYGEALFYFYQEDYFPAIVRLLAAQSGDRLGSQAREAELLLGGMYLSYGHHLEAAKIFERLLADDTDPAIRDRTWFFLAKIWKQRGYIEESQAALGHIQGTLPENLQDEARMLHAQNLIDAGDYEAAVRLLAVWPDKSDWSRYARFNLGVALLRSGNVDQAEVVLDDLGGMNPPTEEMTALRDKANLALGYARLQNDQAAAAKLALERVRLEGPYSNKALLGFGWADAENENFQRALVPWMELRSRDLLDSAVQESMLAIPYALAKLEASSQAADHYLNAIEAYHEESGRIDRTIETLENGSFFLAFIDDETLDSSGWYWRIEELPAAPETRYLYHLLSTHRFQEGLKNYRDLTYMHQNMDAWQQRVDVFEGMLETRKQAYDEQLPRADDALARADLDSMVDRKLEYDSMLNDIEASHDWLALASPEEFEMWAEITGLEATPALATDLPEAAEVRDKIALMKGVLQWDMERHFQERLWRNRKEVTEAGEALVEAQRARRQIDESMRRQPIEFAEFSQRVEALAPRIEALKMRLEDSLAAQRDYMRGIAVGELQAQKERLDSYAIQARFGLATIYDLASAGTEESE